jgi:hypothetical protein
MMSANKLMSKFTNIITGKMKHLSILLLIFFYACSSHYSSEIEAILNYAGNNRSELTQVLNHYSKNSADSLKLKAAEFLIVNMPGKYSKYYDAPWNDVATVFLRWTSSSDKQKVLAAYGLGEPVIREDLKHITAEYLINNIELAFKVWREQPWGKYISFDTFCEEILPYRADHEPLENWREKVLASFADVNRSFQEQPGITAVEACAKINDLLPRFKVDKDFHSMNYSMLMATARGPCDEQANLAVFVMRALGIPVAKDFTPKWPNRNVGHEWNAVPDSSDRHFSFMSAETNPGHVGKFTLLKGKIYRHTFAIRNDIKTDKDNIPPLFRKFNATDVTAEYDETATVEIPVKYQPGNNTGYAYLSIPGLSKWNIIGWGSMTKNNTIHYGALTKNLLYLPVYYENESETPANYPFWLDEKGTIQILEPDTSHLQDAQLLGIAPTRNSIWRTRMYNGVFEGANKPDFSDAQVLHVIKEVNSFNTVKITNSNKYRYIRYVSPDNGSCNVAEIKFFGKSHEELKGAIISTPHESVHEVYVMTPDKAFDNDILTFFEANTKNGGWIGMDLDEKQAITEIHYMPRNDGDGINKGNVYELYYWENKHWQLLGRQTATEYDKLSCQLPSNALFYINNKTMKKEDYCAFIIQNGIQKWLRK